MIFYRIPTKLIFSCLSLVFITLLVFLICLTHFCEASSVSLAKIIWTLIFLYQEIFKNLASTPIFLCLFFITVWVNLIHKFFFQKPFLMCHLLLERILFESLSFPVNKVSILSQYDQYFYSQFLHFYKYF